MPHSPVAVAGSRLEPAMKYTLWAWFVPVPMLMAGIIRSNYRLHAKERELTLYADSDFQIEQVRDVLLAKLTKRGVDVRFVDFSAKPQKMRGDKLKLVAPLRSGIDSATGKKIQAALKASKLKVQGAIQGDAVRVTGAKRDDLQAAMALLRKEIDDQPLSFDNFRD